MRLRCQHLTIGYAGRRVAGPFTAHLPAGQVAALLGPNGVGKSTLLRRLAGLQPPLGGEVFVDDAPLHQLDAHHRARRVAVVLSGPAAGGSLTVEELVRLGRHPHTGWLGRYTGQDRRAVATALALTGTHAWRGRRVDQLSDGERQQVMVARALAQDTPLLLLDEPTAHLDLINRVQVLTLLRALTTDHPRSLLFSTHELDLALRTCDRLWLLDRRGTLTTGLPEELVLDGTLTAAFGPLPAGLRFDRREGHFRADVAGGVTVGVVGPDERAYWTARALTRVGYRVADSATPPAVVVGEADWTLTLGGPPLAVATLHHLLTALRARLPAH